MPILVGAADECNRISVILTGSGSSNYNYLKPDAEKNFLEMCFDSAAEWCKEHWKEIVATVGIIIGAALAAALNIVDVREKIDNPTFNTLQSTLNWTSTISNGLYDIGMLYNAVKYKFGGSFNRGSKGANGAGNFNSNEDAYEYYKNLVENLDVSTGKNSATFYSGKGNRELAEKFANMNGKTTLEMTQEANI